MDMNPKLVGSNLIDAIPQTGKCPGGCLECFYNGGRFYRTLEEPLLPSLEEVGGKIVRVNSGHDSNFQRDHVIESTKQYEHKFYNTSFPLFDFPAPVVFTCNGRTPRFADCGENVMFVRVRANTWELELQDRLVEHYLEQDVSVVLTFMRYYDLRNVKIGHHREYEWRHSILNDYCCIKSDAALEVLGRYKGEGVRMCGTLASSLCVDCRNCELLYWAHLRRSLKLS